MIKNIRDELPNSKKINKDIIVGWKAVAEYLTPDDVYIKSINGPTAVEFMGDFHGLLKHMRISDDALLINTFINGLNSSSDYDASFSDIKLIKDSVYKIYAVGIYRKK